MGGVEGLEREVCGKYSIASSPLAKTLKTQLGLPGPVGLVMGGVEGMEREV